MVKLRLGHDDLVEIEVAQLVAVDSNQKLSTSRLQTLLLHYPNLMDAQVCTLRLLLLL